MNDHCHELPMVFGTETEFGFSCGEVLNEKTAKFFPLGSPGKILNLIVRAAAQKTGAFIRDPGFPWERDGINHFGSPAMKILTKAAVSDDPDDLDNLPDEMKEFAASAGLSSKDLYFEEVGIFLPNGSRLYVDGFHLEYSIGECREPYEVVCQEKAMEAILAETVAELRDTCGQELYLFKNNTDHKLHSYGCHENYLLRSEFFNNLYEDNTWSRAWLSFIATSVIFAGAGKVGSEYGKPCFYQISQRADHIQKIFGSNSVQDRPMIHYRPEPLADPYKWGRLHVILDDSNMSEWSIFLKIGVKALVLNMLQHQFLKKPLCFYQDKEDCYRRLFLEDPVSALQFISRDLTCKKSVKAAGDRVSALEIQKEWLILVKDFYSSFNCQYKAEWIFDVIEKWKQVLTWIEEDSPILDTVLDWRIKRRLINMYLKKRNRAWSGDDEDIKSIDIHYHDISGKGFYNRLSEINRIVEDGDISRARTDPPLKTRAWLRGNLIKRLPRIIDASWELLIFEPQFGDFKTKLKLYPDPLFCADSEIESVFKETNDEEFFKKFLRWHLNRKDHEQYF